MPQQLRHITLQITCVSAGQTCNATRVRACVPRSGVCAAIRQCGSAPPGVSTREPHPEARSDALVAAGREPVVVEKAAGKLARRPELDQALLGTRAGDQLVVTKLDRLGRSRGHLIEPARMLQQRQIDLVVLDQGASDAGGRSGNQRERARGRRVRGHGIVPIPGSYTRTGLDRLRRRPRSDGGGQ